MAHVTAGAVAYRAGARMAALMRSRLSPVQLLIATPIAGLFRSINRPVTVGNGVVYIAGNNQITVDVIHSALRDWLFD